MKKRTKKTAKPAREMTAAESLRACGIGPDVQPPATTVECSFCRARDTLAKIETLR